LFSGKILWVIVNAVLLEKLSMKTFVLEALFLVFSVGGLAQKDTAIVNRINAMLAFTKAKEYDKIMDYTYSKLFAIVPKDALVESMKESFDTDEFSIELDSMKIDTIFPVFIINDTSYVVARHTMLMRMKYTEPFDTANIASTSLMVTLMEGKYGKGNVRFDIVANSLNILLKPDIVGIKEKSSGLWTFVNLNEDNPALLAMLFSGPVRKKLKGYQ
jgi:hypothetical protein